MCEEQEIEQEENQESDKEEVPSLERVLCDTSQIFIYEEITPKLAKEVNKRIIAYSMIRPNHPITVWISSPGGCILSGLSIIDTLLSRGVYIITVVTGEAASMAALISICGDQRIMSENAYWMQHAGAGGAWGNTQEVSNRADWYKKLDKRCDKIIRKKTKFTEEDIQKYKDGELWLDANQAKRKGVVDHIMKIRLRDINKPQKKPAVKKSVKKTKKK